MQEESIGNDPLFDESLTVNIINGILTQMPKVAGEEPLDIILTRSFAVEALLVDLLLNTI